MRPILTAQQVRAADAHTIAHEPITSIDLMERASNACVTFMLDRLLALDRLHASAFVVVSGPGNNGGDGAAIARLLRARGFEVRLAVMQVGKLSPDRA
ncbi:MAG: bifunctional ADP-dependent NAD(P)H-hydrate dehydratase/NAD(P)H-hydrate epimerase, partial [Flavobacteriales bacterium]|nr:bifunctional ADP-dependent NAD(P)H-hydrate dehydratase/NAD(P)H-hydrate epimerase [Flavobacteriales bacterium]